MADYNSDRTGANIDFTLDKVDVRDTVIDIGSNTTNRITVNSAGNVGIGTASPTATLDVRGSAYFISTGGTRTTDTPNGNGVEVIGGATNNMLSYNRTSASYLPIRYRAGVQSWEVNNSEAMRIDSAGNVGIGTASPSAKLDVVGDINVSGGVYLGGTGSANKLDDYEEGIFTPVVKGSTTDGTYTDNYRDGFYTKIGNSVYFKIEIYVTSFNGTGDFLVEGLPFTAYKSHIATLQANDTPWASLSSDEQHISAYVVPNSTRMEFRTTNRLSGSAFNRAQCGSTTVGYLKISGTYTTNS